MDEAYLSGFEADFEGSYRTKILLGACQIPLLFFLVLLVNCLLLNVAPPPTQQQSLPTKPQSSRHTNIAFVQALDPTQQTS